jgi:tetratricopeptide (TPR) repeat protein
VSFAPFDKWFKNILKIFNTEDTITSDSEAESIALSNILEILHARDTIQNILEENSNKNIAALDSGILIALDKTLISQSNKITKNDDFVQARKSLNPPPSSWWWYLEAPPSDPWSSDPWWSRFDQFWNGLTSLALIFSGSYITLTVKAFSETGVDLIGAFSALFQASILALFASGALTDKGQKVVGETLTEIGIPKNLHSEAIFIGSCVFLGVTYAFHANLPLIGEYYYQQGQVYENELDWLSARDQYKRALSLFPDKKRIYIDLGGVYERLGNLSEAEKMYRDGLAKDDPEAAIRLSRVILLQAFEETGWEKSTDEKKEEQNKKIRESENYLNIALGKIQESTQRKPKPNENTNAGNNQKKLFTSGIDLKNVTIEERYLQEKIFITKGIIAWSQINFEKPNNEDLKLLNAASLSFSTASEIAAILPQTVPSSPSECYFNIAQLTNEKYHFFLEKGGKDKISEQEIKEFVRSYYIASLEEVDLSNEVRNSNKVRNRLNSQSLKYYADFLGVTPDDLQEIFGNYLDENGIFTYEAKADVRIFNTFYDQKFEYSYYAMACYVDLASEPGFDIYDGFIMKNILEIQW